MWVSPLCKPTFPLCMHVCVHVSRMYMSFYMNVCDLMSIVCRSVRVHKSYCMQAYITFTYMCVCVRSRPTYVCFHLLGGSNTAQQKTLTTSYIILERLSVMPLSMPLKSVLNLRTFGLELEVLVVKCTSRTCLEDQTHIRVLRLKNSPLHRELPACFG